MSSVTHDSHDKGDLKAEGEILMALSLERKGQNYNSLRCWDQVRAQQLSIHRKTISQLTDYTETSLLLSTNYINVLKQFLTDKHEQFTKYSKYPLAKTNIDTTSILVSLVYKQSLEELNRLHDDAKGYQQSALNMAVVIESLLRKVEEEIIRSESELMTLKEEVNSLNQELLEINQDTSESCAALSEMFHKEKASSTFKSKEDFYSMQEVFMDLAAMQTELQIDLGKEVIKLFSWGQETKFKRQQLIKSILIEYYTTHEEMHKYEVSTQIIEQVKGEEPKKEDCQVEDILDRQSRKDVNRMMGDDDKKLAMEDLFEYIRSLNFNRFDPRNLILKESKATYNNEEGQEVVKYLVVTVDAFLHFLSHKIYDSDTAWTIKLDKSVKIKATSDTSIEVTKDQVSGSLIRNLLHLRKDSASLSISLSFDSRDHQQEFCEFVETLLI